MYVALGKGRAGGGVIYSLIISGNVSKVITDIRTKYY